MQVDLTDSEFRNYLRMRLGMPVCSHQKCQHRATSDSGRACSQISDPMGYHALLCKLGGGLTSTHNAICAILLQAARAAGFSALKEQVVAELATPSRKEPRVDVDAWGLVAEPRVLLDVTVTCSFAERYEAKSAVTCGEHRKDKEYTCKAGLSVTGVAVDVFGKHGPALQELLMRSADLARQHEVDMGVQPRRWLHRWRVRISTELARGCSRQICTASFSSAPVRQQQPVLAVPLSTHTTTTVPPDTSPMGCATSRAVAPADPSPCSVSGVKANVQIAIHPTTPTTTTTAPAEQMA